jgi:hypothetical protein
VNRDWFGSTRAVPYATGGGKSAYGGSPVKRHMVAGFNARKGYSLVDGVGTINASLFVYELAGKKP